MTKQTQQKQDNMLTIESLARSIPKRISVTREKVNLDREAKNNAFIAWDERGERYNAFSQELGNDIANFLRNYVAQLWPTIKDFLKTSREKSFDVDALNRKFMREQPYLSFVPNGDSPIIWYYSGFRCELDYEPTNISVDVLKDDHKRLQDLGERILSEKYFYENTCYSRWDKRTDNVPELPSEIQVRDLRDEFTNCVLTNTSQTLDKLIEESLIK
jgi:hypothetical protein